MRYEVSDDNPPCENHIREYNIRTERNLRKRGRRPREDYARRQAAYTAFGTAAAVAGRDAVQRKSTERRGCGDAMPDIRTDVAGSQIVILDAGMTDPIRPALSGACNRPSRRPNSRRTETTAHQGWIAKGPSHGLRFEANDLPTPHSIHRPAPPKRNVLPESIFELRIESVMRTAVHRSDTNRTILSGTRIT